MLKRLIKKSIVEIREYVIPTTPVYNPLGEGNTNPDPNDPFLETDKKSYQNMINKKHKEQYWENKNL